MVVVERDAGGGYGGSVKIKGMGKRERRTRGISGELGV